ncbi:SAV_2336 N-terminal domain-related protein [Streptomyces sp. NPDC052114]|uniref:SAV_2336 N-terminal domain-related protein n=1 Tax=unclassified Streptomyces TaxID=2593676 RepID=UPI00343507C1
MERATLTELIRRLRGLGLDPDAESLADALWLARWAAPGPGRALPEPSEQPVPFGEPGAGPAPAPEEPDPESLLIPLRPPSGRPHEPRTPLRAGGDPPRPVPFTAAEVPSALPGLLSAQRALRPLQRHRGASRPSWRVLDEEATAEAQARTGLLTPVFRSSRQRRAAAMQVILDSSSSMVVWSRMAEELRQACASTGAFQDVRLYRLHLGPDGGLLVGAGQGRNQVLGSADQLRDPTGNTFTLLISDCAGPVWRAGRAQRFLHRLAALGAPVAVLQPLPQRLWSRTALRPCPGTLRLASTVGLGLHFTPEGPSRTAGGGLPVPVLPPTVEALGVWARLLTGKAPTRVRAAAAWVRPDHPPVPGAGQDRPSLSAPDRVARFRAGASPGAQHLATCLAAVPLVLPVMLLAQRVMLPDTGPEAMAEVLLSGLLSHSNPDGTDGAQWYEFAPGVQEVLLRRLRRDEAAALLKACSSYVERAMGRGAPNFPALAVAQLTGAGPDGDARWRGAPSDEAPHDRAPAPFAWVSARVLRRFLPAPGVPDGAPDDGLARARELLARHSRGEDPGALSEAVDGLRALVADATDDEERAEAATELAGALLGLWARQGGAALLEEAQEAAAKGAGPDAATEDCRARARQLTARLLRARARHRRDLGDLQGAEELLESAIRELDRAARLPVPGTEAALESVLERADLLRELWELRPDDVQALHEAVGGLRAVAVAGAVWAPRMADVHRRLGQTLLSLARAERRPDRAARYAADAVEELALARDLLAAEPDGLRHSAALLLELAQAHDLSGGHEALARTLAEALHDVAYARPDTRVPLLLRIARLTRAPYRPGTADLEPLRRALAVYAAAGEQAAENTPESADVGEPWGETLLDLAAGDGAGDGTEARDAVARAVVVLRECLRATPDRDPAAARRRLLFGRALLARYDGHGDRADLEEADQLMQVLVREAHDPGVLARAWLVRASVIRRRPVWQGHEVAPDELAHCFRRAGRHAVEAGEPFLAAGALRERAGVLDDAGLPRAAADSREEALAVLVAAGEGASETAAELRGEIAVTGGPGHP